MADTRISEETAASTLGGTEVTEGVQGGANVKITATQIKTFANASPTITGHATIEGVTATGATGTGKFVFDGTPTLVTPVLGAATGTSLALNGATLGTNKLAVTGTTLLTGAVTGTSSLTLGIASSATGSLVLANTGSAFATTIQAGNNAAARTYVWPTNFGAAGTVLTDASGDGILSWGAIPSGTITANSTLTSGLTAGQLLYSDATKIQASAGLTVAANSLTIGTASSASGSLVLLNSGGAFTTTLQASASAAASRTYILPVNFGASGSVLTDSAGNGVLSWATAPAAALTVGSTAISSGTTTRILYDNAGTLGEYTVTGSGTEVALSTSPVFITGITSPAATLGVQQTTQGSLVLANTAAGAFATTIKSSNSATAAITYTLPTAGATVAGQVLTDAAANGVLSWATPAGGGLTIGTTTITSGTTTRLLYDLAGVVQESVGGTWNATDQALTIASIANPASSTLMLTGGTALTTSKPVLNMTQTWNAAGTAFTGLKFLITDTASANASLALDISNASYPIFRVGKINTVTGTASTLWGVLISDAIDTINLQIYYETGNGLGTIGCSAARGFAFANAGYGLSLFPGTTVTAASGVTLAPISGGVLQLGHGWGYGADVAAPVAQTIQCQSVVAGTADGTAGKDFTFICSKGTGTGVGGNHIIKTAFSTKGSATSQGTVVGRHYIVAKGKVLSDGTPVSLFEVALPTLAMCGGQIEATVVCTDGTEMQSLTQMITFSSVNKGGTYTDSITATTGDKCVTGGSTLANTWSILDGTNKITVQLSSDTSLTPSANAFLVYYVLKNNSEQTVTIL